jgi:hypothetical protein
MQFRFLNFVLEWFVFVSTRESAWCERRRRRRRRGRRRRSSIAV